MKRLPSSPLLLGLATGLAGYLLAAGAMVAAILRSTSSTAAIGFLFVPFYALVPAVPCFVVGLCLGFFWRSRGAEGWGRRVVGWLALGVAAVLLAAGGGWLVDRALLVWQVEEVLAMDAEELEAYFHDPAASRTRDRFVLGAMAQNPAASAELLDAISRLEDPELHEGMGSVFPLLGDNRSGLAVMRLVARHDNVTTPTLVRLAESPDDYVVGDVAGNEKTPVEVLRRAHREDGYLVEWGLARNEETPPEILRELARSSNEYTRGMVARNPGTPAGVVRELARDEVWHVRRSVVQHPEVTGELLEELAKDPDERVSGPAGYALDRR